MSGINPGKYFIRFEPFGVGSMCATRQETNQPVKLEADVPSLNDSQGWVAIASNIKDHWYIVSYIRDNESNLGKDILSTEDPTGVPAGPVITQYQEIITPGKGGAEPYDKLQKWIVSPVDVPGVPFTYTIQPVTKAVGMNYYVGVKDNELYIQSFPIDDDTPKPYWQFDGIIELDNTA